VPTADDPTPAGAVTFATDHYGRHGAPEAAATASRYLDKVPGEVRQAVLSRDAVLLEPVRLHRHLRAVLHQVTVVSAAVRRSPAVIKSARQDRRPAERIAQVQGIVLAVKISASRRRTRSRELPQHHLLGRGRPDPDAARVLRQDVTSSRYEGRCGRHLPVPSRGRQEPAIASGLNFVLDRWCRTTVPAANGHVQFRPRPEPNEARWPTTPGSTSTRAEPSEAGNHPTDRDRGLTVSPRQSGLPAETRSTRSTRSRRPARTCATR